MPALLALLAAAGWGSSDFAAGLASRRSSAVSVVILTHLTAVVVLLCVAVDIGPLWSSLVELTSPGRQGPVHWHAPRLVGMPTSADVAWAVTAGLGGGFGSMLLFRGLARGSMSIVAPITAAGAAVIPVLVGVATGEALSPLAMAGITLALAAIVLVSLSGDAPAEANDPVVRPVGAVLATGRVAGSEPAGHLVAGAAQPSPGSGTRPGPIAWVCAPAGPMQEPSPMAGMARSAMPVGMARSAMPVGLGVTARGGLAVVGLRAARPLVTLTTLGSRAVGVAAPRRPLRWRRGLAVPGLPEALLSGVGFGVFYVCIAQAGATAGHWPLVSARAVSVVMFTVGAIATSTPVLPAPGSRRGAVAAGVLDAAAAVLFVLSTQAGLLSIGAVLASLYPAVTVVLARVVTNERIGRRQLTGLLLALGAVALLAV